MQPTVFSTDRAVRVLARFSLNPPLVHCMTNTVVQEFTANVLLAMGTSPAMVIDPDEATQFCAKASALLVNVGTLTRSMSIAMQGAVRQAHHHRLA